MGRGPAAVLPLGVAGRVCVVGLWIGLSPHPHLRLATSEGRGRVRLEKKGCVWSMGHLPPPKPLVGRGRELASNARDRNRGRSSHEPSKNPRTRLHLPQRNTPPPSSRTGTSRPDTSQGQGPSACVSDRQGQRSRVGEIERD